MSAAVILEIVRLSLEITLEIIKGIPIEQRQQVWQQHLKNVEFWQGVLNKLKPEDGPKPETK